MCQTLGTKTRCLLLLCLPFYLVLASGPYTQTSVFCSAWSTNGLQRGFAEGKNNWMNELQKIYVWHCILSVFLRLIRHLESPQFRTPHFVFKKQCVEWGCLAEVHPPLGTNALTDHVQEPLNCWHCQLPDYPVYLFTLLVMRSLCSCLEMFCAFCWVQSLYIFVLELQRPCFQKI